MDHLLKNEHLQLQVPAGDAEAERGRGSLCNRLQDSLQSSRENSLQTESQEVGRDGTRAETKEEDDTEEEAETSHLKRISTIPKK